MKTRKSKKGLHVVLNWGEEEEMAGEQNTTKKVRKRSVDTASIPAPPPEYKVLIETPELYAAMAYVILRYYLKRNISVATGLPHDESKFLGEMYDKLRQMRINCGDKQTMDLIQNSLGLLHTRATVSYPPDAIEYAFESINLPQFLESLGYVKKKKKEKQKGKGLAW